MTRQERKVSSPRVVNIGDLRPLAQQRLPRVLFDYLDGGADAEVTLRENTRAFDEVTFRPRNALYIPERDTRTSILGCNLSMPMLLAPCGFSHMFYPQAEPTAARAAGKAGIGYVLTTMSGHRMEDVAAAASGPLWYQLYLAGGHDAGKAAIERAQKAGFSALVITIDTGTFGMRERDVRNGAGALLGSHLLAKIPFLPQVLAHPGWLAGFLRSGGVRKLHNIVVPGRGTLPLSEAQSSLAKSVVTWDDLKWIRKQWTGPIVVKGVMIAEDAKRAVEEGAAGVIVSNHGGRQLDGVAASLRALPEIVAAAGGRAEVLMDGGVRRGSDIAKALCLGARAVLIGRAYMYGLGAAGEAGVARAIAILRADLERTMALLGCKSVAELDRSYVDIPASWAVLPRNC
ncbi:MAG TPA: alpha-hydroxy acid oxidase [Candidatus Acidoferrales bacterium]|jgi:L-lactate dehydrogenase (cytochrome)|nr:alpha-hydroxy acid oxidase [Candidatus Acidoferrales bacterium]